MTSKLFYSLTNLFFLISLLTTLGFDRASSKFERLVKRSNLISKNVINIVGNKTTKIKTFTDKAFIFPSISSSNGSVEILDVNVQTFCQYSGYIPIRHSYDAKLFYFFFKSRGSKNDPVVLWLTGGPGIGSAKSLFYDNGPFHINDDLSLKWNDFGWDKVCNLLYVDQPTGVGFSYSSDHRDMRRNSKEVSEDLYDFLQAFFQAHPDFLENDFYIVGASYSGHTIPLLASRLHTKNKAKEGIHINLKGLGITNGNTNPKYKYSSLPDFFYTNKLVQRSFYVMVKKSVRYNECLSFIKRCQTDNNVCKDATNGCRALFSLMRRDIGNPNPFDFRKQINGSLDFGFPIIKNFLALDHVRRALSVGNRGYVTRSMEVWDAMTNDSTKNYATVIPKLLEDGLKVLIFDGEYDLVCNWLGNLRWMEAMKWSGQKQFLKTELSSYKVDGKKVGKVKNSGPLTFLKVFNAGHTIARDEPYISLQIFKNWLNSR